MTRNTTGASAEEEIYAAALSELESADLRRGLWAKAFAESQGDEPKSKALYIKLRVEQELGRLESEQASKQTDGELSQFRPTGIYSALARLDYLGYRAKKARSGWEVREPSGTMVCLSTDEALLRYANETGSGQGERPVSQQCNEQLEPKISKWESIVSLPATGKWQSISSSAATPGKGSWNQNRPDGPPQDEPSGVGGWLLLLVLKLLVIGPAFATLKVFAYFATSEAEHAVLTMSASWVTYKLFTIFIYAFATLVSVAGGAALLSRNDQGIIGLTIVILWVIGPTCTLAAGALIPFAMFGTQAVERTFPAILLASIFAAAIWTAYLLKSQRVRNTYSQPSSASGSTSQPLRAPAVGKTDIPKIDIAKAIMIFLVPWVFGWITVQRGYSWKSRLITLAWAISSPALLFFLDNRK